MKLDGTDSKQLAELERLCREDLEVAEADSPDELATAIEQLEQAIADDLTLGQALAGCRVSSDPDAAVTHGLHLLTGHKGKRQEFDWVLVLGLENGQIPDFRSEGDADEVEEELRVFHVMASRARIGLGFTFCSAISTKYGLRTQEPSPWLPLLQAVATASHHG